MIQYDDEINKEIVAFIRDCTDSKLPIYNASTISKPPKDKERIEFKLSNFVSTGQIYKIHDGLPNTSEYAEKTISEYRCQLSIRVFDDVISCAQLIGLLAGGIQTFGYLEQFVDILYIKNETMRIRPFIVQKDNTITNLQEIIVDCYVGIEFSKNIDYFTRVEDSIYEIN